MTPDLNRFLRECVKQGILVPVDPLPRVSAQDTRPGLPVHATRAGIRYVEEMTIYAEDGTLLGWMTLRTALVPQVPGLHWLTPIVVACEVR